MRLGAPGRSGPRRPDTLLVAARALPGHPLQARPDQQLDPGAGRRAGRHRRGRHARPQGLLHAARRSTCDTDPELYRMVVEAFPDAWLEDPDLNDETRPVLEPASGTGVTWDAPIHSVADIEALPVAPEDDQHQAVALRPAARAVRGLRLVRARGRRRLRRRPDRAGRRPRPDPVPRVDLPSRHAQRHRAGRLQPTRAAATACRPARSSRGSRPPASAGTMSDPDRR